MLAVARAHAPIPKPTLALEPSRKAKIQKPEPAKRSRKQRREEIQDKLEASRQVLPLRESSETPGGVESGGHTSHWRSDRSGLMLGETEVCPDDECDGMDRSLL